MREKSAPIKSVAEIATHSFNPLNKASIPFILALYHEEPQKLLLCHDMAGGYHDDTWIQGSITSDPVYSVQYWRYISSFCYFTHERVSIPPVVWTNACHRNGTKCFGTFIVEWEGGVEEVLKMIYGPNKGSDFDEFYADKLVALAVFYGFDGYLINIESPLPSSLDCIALSRFLEYLTSELHKQIPWGEIIWYDSVINTGELKWQDQLNEKNNIFFDACDGIFVNYTWNVPRLMQSSVNGGSRKNMIYTGIDVWGGFNTHKALREIQNAKTSTAIFAPAWTFEKLGKPHFEQHERRFWVDSSQPLHLSLKERQDLKVFIDPSDIGCISDFLEPRVLADSFYCCFDKGYGPGFAINGKIVTRDPWQNLGRQSLCPSFSTFQIHSCRNSTETGPLTATQSSNSGVEVKYDSICPFNGSYSLSIYGKASRPSALAYYFEIFNCVIDLSTRPDLIIRIVFKCKEGISVGIFKDSELVFPESKSLGNGWRVADLDLKDTDILYTFGIAVSDSLINGKYPVSAGGTLDLNQSDTTKSFAVDIGSIGVIPKSSISVQPVYADAVERIGMDLLQWEEPVGDIQIRHVFVNEVYLGSSFSRYFYTKVTGTIRIECYDQYMNLILQITNK